MVFLSTCTLQRNNRTFLSALLAGQTVKSKELPLYHFDRFFRSFGSVIVLGVIALRALATLAIPEAFPAPQLAVPAALYASHALIRAALYALHEAGLMFNPRRWPEEVEQKAPHIMSDHILLAASTVAGLASEAMLPLLSVKGTTSRRGRAYIALHVFLATLLAVLVSSESYFTTRWERVEDVVHFASQHEKLAGHHWMLAMSRQPDPCAILPGTFIHRWRISSA